MLMNCLAAQGSSLTWDKQIMQNDITAPPPAVHCPEGHFEAFILKFAVSFILNAHTNPMCKSALDKPIT